MRHAVLLALCLSFSPGGQAQAPAQPGCDAPGPHRALDFWLGHWRVYSGDVAVGSSVIERLPGSCALLESYSQPDGFSGKSLNFYDSVLRQWRQVWVDHLGTVSEFSGQAEPGALQLEGRTHGRNGRVLLRRMRLSAIGVDEVRQHSELSRDEGRTWELAYDYRYRRVATVP